MRKVVIAFIFCFGFFKSFSQSPPIYWSELLGGSKGEAAWSFQLLNDGGFVISARSNSIDGNVSGVHYIDSSSISMDFWIIKLDSSRNVEWQKCLGGSNEEEAFEIKQTHDSGFVVIGNASSVDFDLSDNVAGEALWIVKLDASGGIKWKKPFGGSSNDEGISIVEAENGDLYTAGYTSSNNGNVSGNHGGYDFWILHLDSSGNLLNQKCFGGINWEQCFTIYSTSKGSFIIAGLSGSNDGDVSGNHDTTSNDVWVVNMDSVGNIIWKECYGGSQNEVALEITETFDKGFILAGNTNSNDGDVSGLHNPTSFHNDAWILKIDSVGGIEWQKTVGGSNDDYLKAIQQTLDSGYISAGYTFSNDGDVSGLHGQIDGWIVKQDKYGNVQWQKCVGGSLSELFEDIKQDHDGNYIALGWSKSTDGDLQANQLHGEEDVWLLKLASSVGINEESPFNFQIFPSPANSILKISHSMDEYDICLTNILGVKFYCDKQIGKTESVIDVSNYSPGIYFISLQHNGVQAVKKIIIDH